MAGMDQVVSRLHKALQGGVLPPEGQKVGQRLMAQLHQPTRVAVLGLAGSGKTSVVNMLLGANLMPDLQVLTAVEISYGETERSQITMLDGTITVGEGPLDVARVPPNASRVSLQRPDLRLKEWSFVEITLSPGAPAQGGLLDWMAKRSDIAIWCSQAFDDRERALWSKVPENLKDHSFLALTRADRLYMKGELAERIARLQPIVADEFLSLYPVATLQAAAARQAQEQVNDPLWRSSGGKAFLDGLRQQVEQARVADLDHAMMLLERYKVALLDKGEAVEPEVPAPAAEVATAAPPEVAPPVQRQARPAKDQTAESAIKTAFAILRDCADELLTDAEIGTGDSTERILERCTATVEHLTTTLWSIDDASPVLEALREDVIEGEQMLMLLRLERGETAAEDSLTVLLQLKKDMAERVSR